MEKEADGKEKTWLLLLTSPKQEGENVNWTNEELDSRENVIPVL